MAERSARSIPEIDDAIASASDVFNPQLQLIQAQIEKKRTEEKLNWKIEKQREVIKKAFGRLGLQFYRGVIDSFEYTKEKLGYVARIDDVQNIQLYQIDKNRSALRGYDGCILSYKTLIKPRKIWRFTGYAGLIVSDSIELDWSAEHTQDMIRNNLGFWHGPVFDTQQIVYDYYFDNVEKIILNDAEADLIKPKFGQREPKLFRGALPLNPETLSVRMQQFTQGLAGFVKTHYIPPGVQGFKK